ncbi:P0432B10.21 [Oryza sativa Japonica Group]|uniref:p0432B10.21 protein n=1 Tax=Oryza sativa subsp. japonica TaxID=39947 RepID=Q8RZK8_ORYSJ|nr:P0432B10.21 [Oryza sativa Japonica Group]
MTNYYREFIPVIASANERTLSRNADPRSHERRKDLLLRTWKPGIMCSKCNEMIVNRKRNPVPTYKSRQFFFLDITSHNRLAN